MEFIVTHINFLEVCFYILIKESSIIKQLNPRLNATVESFLLEIFQFSPRGNSPLSQYISVFVQFVLFIHLMKFVHFIYHLTVNMMFDCYGQYSRRMNEVLVPVRYCSGKAINELQKLLARPTHHKTKNRMSRKKFGISSFEASSRLFHSSLKQKKFTLD